MRDRRYGDSTQALPCCGSRTCCMLDGRESELDASWAPITFGGAGGLCVSPTALVTFVRSVVCEVNWFLSITLTAPSFFLLARRRVCFGCCLWRDFHNDEWCRDSRLAVG